jgi:hydroxypyruvate reductase
MRFENSVLIPDPERRALILPVLDAALEAADPAAAVHRALRRQHNHFYVGEALYDLNAYQDVYVVGFGKAATPMIEAIVQILGDRVRG